MKYPIQAVVGTTSYKKISTKISIKIIEFSKILNYSEPKSEYRTI